MAACNLRAALFSECGYCLYRYKLYRYKQSRPPRRNTKRAEQFNIHFEKAAVAFNLGAVQSQAALAADRKTEEGLKESAKHFQVCFFFLLWFLWHTGGVS